MRKVAISTYLLWTIFLLISGIYIVHKINDKSDPSSLSSNLEKWKDAINEDPKIP